MSKIKRIIEVYPDNPRVRNETLVLDDFVCPECRGRGDFINEVSRDRFESVKCNSRTLKANGNMKAVIGGRKRNFSDMTEDDPMYRASTNREYEYTDKANKRSVWEVSTSAFHDAHFAVFPPALIVDCIKAGCPEDGVVLDPFMGSGTTAIVSRKLNRNYVGFEINKDYVRLAENRIVKELGIFQ